MNEAKRRAFRALGIGPLWRLRAGPAGAAGAAVDASSTPLEAAPVRRESAPVPSGRPAMFLLSDESGDWLFVGENVETTPDGDGTSRHGDTMRLLERMLAALELRPARSPAEVLPPAPAPAGDPFERSAGDPSDDSAGARRDDALAARIGALGPRVIVALGSAAAQALLGTDDTVTALRGRVHEWRGGSRAVPLVVSGHPSQLLEAPHEKAAAWADLCLAAGASRVNACSGR